MIAQLSKRNGSYYLSIKNQMVTFNTKIDRISGGTVSKAIHNDSKLPLNKWLHIAATYDGNTMKLYINGQLQQHTIDEAGTISATTNPLELFVFRARGVFEELRISDIARTNFGVLDLVTEQVDQQFYYNGWQVLEQHEQLSQNNVVTVPMTLRYQFVDGAAIDEHLTLDKYNTAGTSIASTLYYHQNYRGDIVSMSNSGGFRQIYLEYSPYGEVFERLQNGQLKPFTNDGATIYSFQGRRLDQETGLHYFRNRYYSATEGRFIQRDPLGYIDSLGLYEAFGGNPLVFGDPLGLFEDPYGNPWEIFVERNRRAIYNEAAAAHKELTDAYNKAHPEEMANGGASGEAWVFRSR